MRWTFESKWNGLSSAEAIAYFGIRMTIWSFFLKLFIYSFIFWDKSNVALADLELTIYNQAGLEFIESSFSCLLRLKVCINSDLQSCKMALVPLEVTIKIDVCELPCWCLGTEPLIFCRSSSYHKHRDSFLDLSLKGNKQSKTKNNQGLLCQDWPWICYVAEEDGLQLLILQLLFPDY